MTKKIYKFLAIFLMIQILLSSFAPIVAYANDAVMLEPLIEPQTKTYKVDIVDDKPTWFANHYEQKYINFDSFYTKICTASTSGSDFDASLFAKNPTLCSSLDSTVSLSHSTITGSLETITDAYDMYMFTEGFRTDTGSLISDDSKKATTEDNAMAKTSTFISGTDKNGIKALTFPSSHSEAKDVSEAESSYAIDIGNTLGANINSLLAFINNGRKFQSVTELVNKSILIRPTRYNYTIVKGNGNDKNFVILYGTLESYNGTTKAKSDGVGSLTGVASSFTADSFWNTGGFPNIDSSGNLLAYVIPTSQTNIDYGSVDTSKMDANGIASFIWAMPKGYTQISDIPNSLKFTNEEHEEYDYVKNGDVPWITIHQLTMYANNAYKNFNISMSTKITAEGNGNMIMEIIVGIVKMLINGLRSILGLSDTYSLVYNKGVRGSSSYNYGAMPDSWWTVVLRYHIIFQSLAWFLIITGLIKTLIDLNLSTINPGKRMHVYKTIERFIIVGFGLVLVIPIVQFMLNMNDSIVRIFASQADPNASSPPVIGTLAGLILQVAYFGIVVYINFTYIMRSIIIGLLVVTAPYFIASMAFSDNNRQLFSSWARELIANIFMQSIHAFTLAFLTNLVSTGGGLESLVVSYSIIPITELVRTLVFQGAGSAASQLGKAAGAKYMNMAQGAYNTGMGFATGMAAKGLDKGSETGDTSLSEGSKSGKGAGSKGADASGVQGLSTAIDSRMSGIKNAAEARMSSDQASSKSKGMDALKKAGASAVQAGLAGAGAISSIGSAAWDMAMGEMTNDVSSYKSVGSNLATAAKQGKSTMKSAAQSIGSATSGASQLNQARKESKNGGGSSPANDENLGLMASSVNRDDRTGLTMAKFNNSARGGAIYANEGRDLTETISSEGIEKLASGNSQLAAFYGDVKKIQAGDNDTRLKYEKEGIHISPASNGSGAKIKYSEQYLRNNNIISATASKDGQSFVTRSHENVGVFGYKNGTSTYNDYRSSETGNGSQAPINNDGNPQSN